MTNIYLTWRECKDVMDVLDDALRTLPGTSPRAGRIERLRRLFQQTPAHTTMPTLPSARLRMDTARTEEEVAKLSPLAMLQRLTHVVTCYHDRARTPCPYCARAADMPCEPNCFAAVTINGILAAKENT